MLNFELRTGPVFSPAPRYPDVTVPDWWRDMKLGVFVHWGIYSVPAWAEVYDGSYIPPEQSYAHHHYAEWIGNTMRIPGSLAAEYVAEKYGFGTSYEDLADHFDASLFDATAIMRTFRSIGAGYVIPTAKHHDGFCLWDTQTTPFNAVNRGPKRDLISEFVRAARAADLRVGLYYSGALDWHVSDFPAIQSNRELFVYRRNDVAFAKYCAEQLGELISTFRPDILWNDIEWPDAGKGVDDFGLAALLRDYLAQVPSGVVNDRFGIPVHGHLTREYSDVEEIIDHPWEATRGLGASFGYNQQESNEHVLSAPELVKLLAHTVARNGNLLLNIGLDAAGRIPEIYIPTLNGLAWWMDAHGDAVIGTRPYRGLGEPNNHWAAVTKNDEVFIYLMQPETGEIPGLDHALFTLDGRPVAEVLPDDQRGLPVAVLRAAHAYNSRGAL